MSLKTFAKGFKQGFQEFGIGITNIVNFVLLVLAYFIGVGITALLAKLSKKSFLDLGDKSKSTYWVKDVIDKKKLEEYYRQF